MGSTAEQHAAAVLPPRRGKVWAVAVDSTVRVYDLSALALGGAAAPERAGTRPTHVYFDSVTGTALADATVQAATSAAVAMADAHGAILEAGGPPLMVRIDRSLDKFLVLKVTSTAGVLRMWACSASE